MKSLIFAGLFILFGTAAYGNIKIAEFGDWQVHTMGSGHCLAYTLIDDKQGTNIGKFVITTNRYGDAMVELYDSRMPVADQMQDHITVNGLNQIYGETHYNVFISFMPATDLNIFTNSAYLQISWTETGATYDISTFGLKQAVIHMAQCNGYDGETL